jgi:hypothetical protein
MKNAAPLRNSWALLCNRVSILLTISPQVNLNSLADSISSAFSVRNAATIVKIIPIAKLTQGFNKLPELATGIDFSTLD